ncbi:MAG: hypothetical protein GY698_13515 [Actinomycetia bacterium]|nr:hypothetical protein [Actinomycetes bacterium]
MSSVGRFWAGALFVVGCTLALWPFVIVWWLSGQVLDELPVVPGAVIVSEEPNRLGLFDEDFELATVTYRGTTLEAVRAVLRDSGFHSYSRGASIAMAREWSGSEYDGVTVDLSSSDSGEVVAQLSVVDTDIQAAWPFTAMFGALLVVLGTVPGARRRLPPEPAPDREDQLESTL